MARESFVEIDGTIQPAPTPKFDRTKPKINHSPVERGADTETILKELGFAP